MVNFFIERHRRTAKYYLEELGNSIALDMVLIPEGEFIMGAPEGELESRDDERPQHKVSLPTFFMGRYPVTQAQWRVVAAFPQMNRELKSNPSNFKAEKRPVEQVSWYEAVEFCQRLSRYTGREYRLPSESEWEYAARAGTTTPFHFGETITTDLANYRGTDNEEFSLSGSYGKGPKGEYRAETTPVDKFDIANNFGLYDMHGLVWEWCLDHYHQNYQNAPTDGSPWLEDDQGNSRILRGGSWFSNPNDCRSAARFDLYPEFADFFIGFRVMCEVPRTP